MAKLSPYRGVMRVHFLPLLGALIGSVTACAKSDRQHASVDQRPGVADSASGPQGDAAARVEAARIVVNGQALSVETVQQLQQVYPVVIPPGRYWYDAVSGAYGREGEPIAGQMMAGLALGGPLGANASRGTSGVFINGRQITGGEVAYIERLCQTAVVPGRYWIMASGVGGYEGGPAIFNLAQCPGVPQQSSGSRSSSRTYCDPNGACTTSGVLGSILTSP
jgi:hypothetical protein